MHASWRAWGGGRGEGSSQRASLKALFESCRCTYTCILLFQPCGLRLLLAFPALKQLSSASMALLVLCQKIDNDQQQRCINRTERKRSLAIPRLAPTTCEAPVSYTHDCVQGDENPRRDCRALLAIPKYRGDQPTRQTQCFTTPKNEPAKPRLAQKIRDTGRVRLYIYGERE